MLRSLTAASVGAYMPTVRSRYEPETPGSTSAHTAIAAAIATTHSAGSWSGACGSPVSRKVATAASRPSAYSRALQRPPTMRAGTMRDAAMRPAKTARVAVG